MPPQFSDPIANQIVGFLEAIGLDVAAAKITDNTFLPGILVERGTILVDDRRLEYPGDLLHEAGHLAVATPELRKTLGGEVTFPGQPMEPVEAQAMAWSYAAALHLGVDPTIVFHEGGYGGRAESLLLNFKLGVFIGVNGLEEAGLTVFGETAVELCVPPYPHMLKWLRE